MKQYPKFESLRKRDREHIIREYPDFLAKIAVRTCKTKATVSRVFAGLIRRSPEVKQAIEAELCEMEASPETTNNNIGTTKMILENGHESADNSDSGTCRIDRAR